MSQPRISTLRVCILLALSFVGSAAVWAQARPAKPEDAFYLRKGDVVLFLGDQNVTSKFYAQIYVEEMKSRYPELVMRDGVVARGLDGPNLKFNLGSIESESVEQGANSIEERLLTFKPTVCVLCYGQSDWAREADKYEASLRKLVKALQKANVDVIVMTAPPVTKADNPKKDAMVAAMGKLAESARKVALEEQVGLAEAYLPAKDILARKNHATSDDGLRPNGNLTWLMTATMKEAWNVGKPPADKDQPRYRPWPKEFRPNTTQPVVIDPNKPRPPRPGRVRVQEWVNITGDIGSGRWGPGGVTVVAAWPGGEGVFAGVSDRGWWFSSAGEGDWQPLGDGKREYRHRPYQIVFDPKEPTIFWLTGWNAPAAPGVDKKAPAPGLFKSIDAGKSLQAVGNLTAVAGLSIDFGDAERKTMICGLYGQPRSVQKSTDGGKTWEAIGAGLPEKTANSSDVALWDSQTYLVGVSSIAMDKAFGIFRTEDGGKTWKKVSDHGPAGKPLRCADGTLYWSRIWSQGLIRSTDGGKTWQEIDAPARKTPVEVLPGKLMSFAGDQLYVSADGKAWKPWGPKIPFAAGGITYSRGRNSLFGWWSSGDRRVDNAIWRLDLPDDVESIFK